MDWRALKIKYQYSVDLITEWQERHIKNIEEFHACTRCNNYNNYKTEKILSELHEQPFNPEPNIITVKVTYQIKNGDHYCEPCINWLEENDIDWAIGLMESK